MDSLIEVIGDILGCIIKYVLSFFGVIIQGLAGVIFNCMEIFLKQDAVGDKSIIEKVMEPLLTFSTDYLVPIALSLMILICMWRLCVSLFGELTSGSEEPLMLIMRAVLFAILLANSQLIINAVSDDFVLTIVSEMGSVNVETSKEATKGFEMGSDNAVKNINETFNTDITNEDISDLSGEVNEDAVNGGITVGSSVGLAIVSYAVGAKAVFMFFVALLIYFAVWGILVLVMAWKCIGVCYKWIQRMVSFLFVLYMAPLALTCGPSKKTQRIFEEWCMMLASYALTLVLTTGLLRVIQEIVYHSFIYAGEETNIIVQAMIFGIAIAFIDVVNQLEQYIDKLGFTAVGFQNKSFAGAMMAQTVARAVSSKLFGGKMSSSRATGANAGSGRSIGKAPDGGIMSKAMGRFGSTNMVARSIKDSTGKGFGDLKDTVSQMKNNVQTAIGKKGTSSGEGLNMRDVGSNARNLIKDAGGNIIKDKNGVSHAIADGAVADKNGMITALDNVKVPANGPRFSDVSTMDKKFSVDGKDPLGNHVNVASAKGFGFKENEDGMGRYYVGSNGIAVDRGSLANDGVFYDKAGNVVGADYSGDKYAETKSGSIVNVGNAGTTYDRTAHGSGSDNINVEYMTSDKGNYIWDTMNDNVKEGHLYNDNLEPNAKILDTSRIESFRQLNEETRNDGSVVGTLKQRLDDGTSCFRSYTLVPNNEVHRDFINNVLGTNPTDPCTGYTVDGKYFMVAGEVTRGRYL